MAMPDERPSPSAPTEPLLEWPHQPPSAPPTAGAPDPGTVRTDVGWGAPPFPPSHAPAYAPTYPPAPTRSAPRPLGWLAAMTIAAVVALLLGVGAYAVSGRVASMTDIAAPPVAGRVVPPAATPDAPRATIPGSGGRGGSSSGGSSSGGTSTWAEVAAAIDPGVVDIETRMRGGIGAGTGMVLTADGEILTNNHVVEGASEIVVTTVVDGETYRAQVVGTDPAEDIAVLQLVGASDLATIALGDSDAVGVGDPIAAIGNAGGQGGEPVVAPGTVVALDQQITASDQDGSNPETLTGMIQVDADVQPGDSGGPLADASGHAIGINTAASAGRSRYRTSTNQGFAIPINHALAVADELVADASSGGSSSGGSSSGGSSSGGSSRATTPGHLGVEVRTGTGGVRVVAVEADSGAADAGLQAGDTITAIDGAAIGSTADLSAALQDHASGDEVTLSWTTARGAAHQATATLG